MWSLNPWNFSSVTIVLFAFDAIYQEITLQMKLQVMSDWIKDLGEQNAMLVHTVEDLEQAACSRVKLLEEKLKQSSQMVLNNLTESDHSEKARKITYFSSNSSNFVMELRYNVSIGFKYSFKSYQSIGKRWGVFTTKNSISAKRY